MEKNFFLSYLNNDRIEICSGLFSSASIINCNFYLKVQIEGHPDRFFNFYDYESVLNYIFFSLNKKKNQKNLLKNKTEAKENLKIDNLHSNWLSLINNVDKEVLAVHKMNFHSTGFKKYEDLPDFPDVKLIFLPKFYDYKFLVEDAKKYRAANIAFNNIDYLLYYKNDLATDLTSAHNFFNSILLKEIERKNLGNSTNKIKKIEKNQLQDNLFSNFDFQNIYEINKVFEEAQNWMNLFSYNGKTYRALNKTLMNLPPQIPEGIVCMLQRLHIHKPLTERLEFLLYFLSDLPYHQRIYRNSNSEQIKAAYKIYCNHKDQKVTYSTTKLYDFLLFLDDYREDYHGNIIDLTKRAIKWHEEYYNRDLEHFSDYSYIDYLDRETAKPPIPLPKNENLKFLATAEEIFEEGNVMRHCVATYIEQAVSGQCYLFHIDYNGEKATAEIDRFGFIKQIKGVENKHNSACDYGMLALKEWSKKLSSLNKHSRDTYNVDYIEPF
ncbi:MAG: PcfJ domain-containing protein [Candidatus Kapabacteria bacterium]|nr:PcfJ domain-containing protein [Candidatus Kapabacteria bacterium]